ncbi:hypothetical protein TNCV_41971 [Trichonephila clavipes]|nr:hypothetical protein TNCV_41971 [Trichonephila clavipes]
METMKRMNRLARDTCLSLSCDYDVIGIQPILNYDHMTKSTSIIHNMMIIDCLLVLHFEATRGFFIGDGPRNFKPWLRDEVDN